MTSVRPFPSIVSGRDGRTKAPRGPLCGARGATPVHPQKGPDTASRPVTVAAVTAETAAGAPGPCPVSSDQPTSPRAGQMQREQVLEPTFAPRAAPAHPPRASALPVAGGADAEPAPRWLPLREDLHDIRVNQFRENDSRRRRACPITGNGVPDGFLQAGGCHFLRTSAGRMLGGRLSTASAGTVWLALWGVKLKSSSPLRHRKDVAQEGLLVGGGGRGRASAWRTHT